MEDWHLWLRYYDEEKDRAERLEKENAALKEHVAALLAEQDCGCGYDKPTDVCLGHLPLHRKTVARAERLEAALRKLHHAVCGETGFAACVRLDSGKAYPWPALDEADAAARAALKGDDHE